MATWANRFIVGLTLILGLLVNGAVAGARPSFIFMNNPDEGFGPWQPATTVRYQATIRNLTQQNFTPLADNYGSSFPSQLRIVLKNDLNYSPFVQKFVAALSFQKPNLMHLYKLTNLEYNHLAALAFGILGRETKFGNSWVYWGKENAPSGVHTLKVAKKVFSSLTDAWNLDSSAFLSGEVFNVNENSRGPTQIKRVPDLIEKFYCVDESILSDPEIAAIATLGFLAQSLSETRHYVRSRDLTYIDEENIYDYVLYVYFGAARQLVKPVFGKQPVLATGAAKAAAQYVGEKAGAAVGVVYDKLRGRQARDQYVEREVQINNTATPSKNLYIQKIRELIRSLAYFENVHDNFPTAVDNACR